MANSALEWTGVALHLLLYFNHYSKPGIRVITCNTEKEKREKSKELQLINLYVQYNISYLFASHRMAVLILQSAFYL